MPLLKLVQLREGLTCDFWATIRYASNKSLCCMSREIWHMSLISFSIWRTSWPWHYPLGVGRGYELQCGTFGLLPWAFKCVDHTYWQMSGSSFVTKTIFAKAIRSSKFFFNFLIFLLVCLLPCTLCWFCLHGDCCKSCHLASHGVVLAVPPNHVISRSLRFTKHFKCYYLVLFLTPLVISIIVTTSSSLDHCSGRTGGWLQMKRSSLRNNRLKFETSGELPIILGESIDEYTSNEWKRNRKMSTCNQPLDLDCVDLDRLCPKTSRALL